MLQSTSSVFVVYRRKTITGSPDPTRANVTNKPCNIVVLWRDREKLYGDNGVFPKGSRTFSEFRETDNH